MKNCITCKGILFETRGGKKFCSRKCYPKRRGGVDYTRDKVRERDNHTCQECKKVWKVGDRRFDVHHLNGLCGKKSKKYDKISEMDGLITLCHKCHFNRHDWAGREKLSIKKFESRDKKIFAHRKKGWSYQDIASKYSISRQRVHMIVKRSG